MSLFPPDTSRDEEGLINLLHLAFGRRQAEALLLAVPVLQERGIRLVKYLDKGTYGAAYLTNRAPSRAEAKHASVCTWVSYSSQSSMLGGCCREPVL